MSKHHRKKGNDVTEERAFQRLLLPRLQVYGDSFVIVVYSVNKWPEEWDSGREVGLYLAWQVSPTCDIIIHGFLI